MREVKQLLPCLAITAGVLFVISCAGQGKMKSLKPGANSPLMLAGKWVPEDPRTIDFDRLPRFAKSDHVIVHDVRPLDGHRVNQHNYMIFHDGLYWMMWSDGPGVVRAKP